MTSRSQRPKPGGRTTFRKWVNMSGGAASLAKLLGMSEHTVEHWMRGRGAPTAATLFRLEALSKGRLTVYEIFQECTRNTPKHGVL